MYSIIVAILFAILDRCFCKVETSACEALHIAQLW